MTSLLTLQLSRLKSWPPPSTTLLLIWLLSMIALPILYWTQGDAVLPLAISISAVLQAAAVFTILAESWGWRRTAGTAVFVAVATFLVEYIGSHTGLPFGDYHYTGRLQPQIGGVPLLIPIAWFMMLGPAWAVASQQPTRLRFTLVAAAALTAWDLLLDPQMVTWNLWQWDQPGLYFGIPLLNFFGWFLTASLITWVVRTGLRPAPAFNKTSQQQLLSIYTLTWFLEAFGLILFWDIAGPGLVGGLVMGFFVWYGWRGATSIQ